MKEDNNSLDYDYIIIGSGFGGSVSAYRLSQKGYRILVIERGKWWKPEDFPKSNWNLPKWLWIKKLRFFGIMQLSFFRHVTTITGVGVGGGSLVYANTLPAPGKQFFKHGSWAGLRNWEAELKPYYSKALQMLGATLNPELHDSDYAYLELAREMGVENKFGPTNVGVFFGEPGKRVPDPYFNGQGPQRAGCTHCGSCMTGCPHDAKNSLDKNYLYLAQKNGAKIMAETNVVDVTPLGSEDGADGYAIYCRSATGFFNSRRKNLTAKGVIFSGGVLGTLKLLLKAKANQSLPALSDRLGDAIRTNNEALIGITNLDGSRNFSDGIAIGSIINLDDNTHIEPCRYSEGSGFWRLLFWPLVQGDNAPVRLFNIFKNLAMNPLRSLKWMTVNNYGRKTLYILFMQSVDSTLNFSLNKLGFMVSRIDSGKQPTPFLPLAFDVARRLERLTNSKASALAMEPLAAIPSTAHILGGCTMGESASEGVIDKNNRVFGYKNMYVCDGSMISANPGVNPALSITAITEYAMSKIPPKAGCCSKTGNNSAISE